MTSPHGCYDVESLPLPQSETMYTKIPAFLLFTVTWLAGCSGTATPGAAVPGFTPLEVSNDAFRPGAIVMTGLTRGGKPEAPVVICNAKDSVGQPDENGQDRPSENPAGDWSQSTENSFKTSAEAKVLSLVTAKGSGSEEFKVVSDLTNSRLLQLTEAQMLYSVCNKKRTDICNQEIHNKTDQNRQLSIVRSVVIADVVFSVSNKTSGEASAGVDLSAVSASLGSNFSKIDATHIKGSGLTIAYAVDTDPELLSRIESKCPRPR